jgi:hypothetical protein
MGIPRFIVGRVLNHPESGVTAVYDRHSYHAEKKDAPDKWATKLMRSVSDLKAVGKSWLAPVLMPCPCKHGLAFPSKLPLALVE